MIALIDYGGGNVGSVLKAIRYLGCPAEAVARPEELRAATKIILPGQGHFGAMMKALEDRGMLEPLRRMILPGDTCVAPSEDKPFPGSAGVPPAQGKPFLGICLGLQVLYEGSDEAPGVPGLGVLRGRVKRFEGVFKVPHVGWSQLEISQPARLLRGIEPGSFVYYCHSYYGPVTPESAAITDYGQRFAAVVEAANLGAVQFHPEKSGEAGLRVLKNFLDS
jgi:imidazoleglycerol phosphate synthase glutamine amidotransferase subunit HisH